jgi:hypothetical protein
MSGQTQFYQIEKGVPMPRPTWKRHGGSPKRAIWHDLDVGDSILLPSRNSVQPAFQWSYRNGVTFTQRKVRGGWRLWRTA